MKAVRPRAFVRCKNFWRLGRSYGARLWSCVRWGALLRLFGAALGYVDGHAATSSVFYPCVRRPHPARASPPFLPRDVSPAGSWLISIGERMVSTEGRTRDESSHGRVETNTRRSESLSASGTAARRRDTSCKRRLAPSKRPHRSPFLQAVVQKEIAH